ncbi:MAG: energy-coupling factor ABC transporter ATP-binding protein [Bacilli bacterium]
MEIKFDNVTYAINAGTSLEKTLVKDISFEINNTNIYAFIGSSNSGKTIIGNMMNSLITPLHGNIFINNINICKKRIRKSSFTFKSVGLVQRNPYNMFFNKSVRKELEFALDMFNYKTKDKHLRIKNACRLFGINEDLLNVNPLDLGYNDAKKVAIASVFLFNPSIIILDESENGMSYYEKDELRRILLLLKNKYNKTIILLSKNTDFIYSTASYVFILNKSKLITKGDISLLENKDLMHSNGLKVPFIVDFINKVNDKTNVMLSYNKDIRDTVKEVFRNVQ